MVTMTLHWWIIRRSDGGVHLYIGVSAVEPIVNPHR